MEQSLKIYIGIATAGRAEILAETLREISRQTRLPDGVVICPAAEADFDAAQASKLPFPVFLAKGKRGLTAQRNAILDFVIARVCAVIVFLDDDFFPLPSFLAEVERCFTSESSVVAASGWVFADGINGPGFSVAEARAALASFKMPSDLAPLADQCNAYGCNMVLRLAPIRAHGLRFDENLPLYGWLEDVDFCRRLAAYGRVVRDSHLIGVHLGVKRGRTSGLRFGYSQVANPFYLWRKGSLQRDHAMSQIGRNLLANFGSLIRREPWVDRRGRALGNMLAVLDLFRGRLDPRRILELR